MYLFRAKSNLSPSLSSTGLKTRCFLCGLKPSKRFSSSALPEYYFDTTVNPSEKLFNKVLIANRGEIACRVIATCKRLGIPTVAVYSDSDSQSLHVRLADEKVHIGASASKDSYLRMDRIVESCKLTGAEAVHPGFGFLSENTIFASLLKDNGITFIGPPSDAIKVRWKFVF